MSAPAGTARRQHPRTTELTGGKEIAVGIGAALPEIPKTADFSNA
jgi:hypothetical protein